MREDVLDYQMENGDRCGKLRKTAITSERFMLRIIQSHSKILFPMAFLLMSNHGCSRNFVCGGLKRPNFSSETTKEFPVVATLKPASTVLYVTVGKSYILRDPHAACSVFSTNRGVEYCFFLRHRARSR